MKRFALLAAAVALTIAGLAFAASEGDDTGQGDAGVDDKDVVGAIVRAQAEVKPEPSLPPIADSTHPSVDEFARRQSQAERAHTAAGLARYAAWGSRIGAVLERHNMPRELLALAFVESRYKPKAASPSDAGGFWQILPATARLHDLRRDAFTDDRYDPERATEFACAYLRELYGQFGDWYLAMAAYNLGKGNLTRLLETGAPRDFFALRDKGLLRAETADYVPRILAARRIMNDPKTYGFDEFTLAPDETEGLVLRPLTDLLLLETLAGVAGGTLAAANPGLRTDYTPPDPGGFRVLVPSRYRDRLDEINTQDRATAPYNELRGLRRMAVKVKGKRTLYSIGRDYDTSLSSLRAWNNLGREQGVSRGDTVIVYVRDNFITPPDDR